MSAVAAFHPSRAPKLAISMASTFPKGLVILSGNSYPALAEEVAR